MGTAIEHPVRAGPG